MPKKKEKCYWCAGKVPHENGLCPVGMALAKPFLDGMIAAQVHPLYKAFRRLQQEEVDQVAKKLIESASADRK
jgi:hypothetical protein